MIWSIPGLHISGLMGRMSRSPAGASVSIRFDGLRFRARHQDHGASAPMARAKRGPSTKMTPALLSVGVDFDGWIISFCLFHERREMKNPLKDWTWIEIVTTVLVVAALLLQLIAAVLQLRKFGLLNL